MPDLLASVMAESPDNFVIQNALAKCVDVIGSHSCISCSVSGGADSDVMLDMVLRCGGKGKTTFVFFDTGLEYQATKEHLDFLEEKYDIKIVRERAVKSIPTSCREYGVPFWSKYASDCICSLQMHGFQWEDEPFDTLVEKYPGCKAALKWWCAWHPNGECKSTQFSIERVPYLKEFMVQNPPHFKISDKCCTYAKKKCGHAFDKKIGADLNCIGARKAEGGIRSAAYTSCFDEREGDIDSFRPIFWFSNADREEYCQHYNVIHSRCYTEYGLERTGCAGCPFGQHGKRGMREFKATKQYEPQLYKAANNIFGESYQYTRDFLEFRRLEKKKVIQAKQAETKGH